MKILVTNDDGIHAEGLWVLAGELAKMGEVTVVAPDREQSAIGTAITLFQPLQAQKTRSHFPGMEAYAVAGTPGDSVILGLRKLVEGPVDLVVSGINHGPNVGSDVLISGTVGAALQAYLQGFPSIAVSVAGRENPRLEVAGKLAAVLAGKFAAGVLPPDILLNVNVPNLPLEQIKGARITALAGEKYASTIQETCKGKKTYYWLEHRMLESGADEVPGSDARAIYENQISITPLHIHYFKNLTFCADGLCDGLLNDLVEKEQPETIIK